ncbi:MAG: dihydrodipicolinate synthase family protein [Ostreibacterium sp.]
MKKISLASRQGIHSVLYALFQQDGTLNINAMQHQTELVLESGVTGINVLGLATEVQKLSIEEQQTIIKTIAKIVTNKHTYSVTVSGQSIKQQRQLVQYALEHGAHWIILQPPSVGQYVADVYLDFFLKVVEGFDCHFAIQNAPQYLSRSLDLKDIEKLHNKNSQFDIIKTEVSATDLSALRAVFNSDLAILNGRGGLQMTDCLRAGASGFILAPDLVDYAQTIFEYYKKEQYNQAETTYAKIAPTIMFLMYSIEHLVCYGKRLFGLRTGLDIFDRSPCLLPTSFGLSLTQHWHKHVGQWSSINE